MTSPTRLLPKSPAPAAIRSGRKRARRSSGTALYIAAALCLPHLPAPALAMDPAPAMLGDIRIHDPSAIDVGGHWVTFEDGSMSKLQISPIRWSGDGWPELAPPP